MQKSVDDVMDFGCCRLFNCFARGCHSRRGRCSTYVGDEWAEVNNSQNVADLTDELTQLAQRHQGKAAVSAKSVTGPYARWSDARCTLDCRRPYQTRHLHNVTRAHHWPLNPPRSPGPSSKELTGSVFCAIGVWARRRHMEHCLD